MDKDWKAIFLNAHNYVGKVELQVAFFFDKMYYCWYSVTSMKII